MSTLKLTQPIVRPSWAVVAERHNDAREDRRERIAGLLDDMTEFYDEVFDAKGNAVPVYGEFAYEPL